MTKTEVINYFGSISKAADALNIRYQSVYEWPENGVPIGRQYQIELLTKGALKAEAARRKYQESV